MNKKHIEHDATTPDSRDLAAPENELVAVEVITTTVPEELSTMVLSSLDMVESSTSVVAIDPPALPGRNELLAMTAALYDPGTSAIDALRAGLCYHLMDPIALNIRNRDAVIVLIEQASRGVHVLTSMAEHLGIHFGGSPVKATNNYTIWSHEDLRQIGALINAHMDSAIARGAAGEALAQTMGLDLLRVEDDRNALKRKITALETQLEEIRTGQKNSVLQVNTIIASYHDQGMFLVAQVDPVTGNPIKFVREELEGDHAGALSSAPTLARASKYPEWGDANDVRLRIIKKMRDKAKLGVVGSTQPSIAVMQLSLRTVRAEDL